MPEPIDPGSSIRVESGNRTGFEKVIPETRDHGAVVGAECEGGHIDLSVQRLELRPQSGVRCHAASDHNTYEPGILQCPANALHQNVHRGPLERRRDILVRRLRARGCKPIELVYDRGLEAGIRDVVTVVALVQRGVRETVRLGIAFTGEQIYLFSARDWESTNPKCFATLSKASPQASSMVVPMTSIDLKLSTRAMIVWPPETMTPRYGYSMENSR